MDGTRFDGVKKVVQVRSNESGSCEECLGPTSADAFSDTIADAINHYIGHGFRLLHIGQETILDSDGEPAQRTVALLGKSWD
jgi:hypothetical protein